MYCAKVAAGESEAELREFLSLVRGLVNSTDGDPLECSLHFRCEDAGRGYDVGPERASLLSSWCSLQKWWNEAAE